LSDYFEDISGNGGTLISVGITKVDQPNKNGLIAKNASDKDIIEEAFKQLLEVYPSLPQYDSAIIGSRIGQETAYIQSSKDPSFLPATGDVTGLYNAGTQNGQAVYSFTSMESAVVNAVELARLLDPEVSFSKVVPWTLNQRITTILILLIIILVCIFIGWKKLFSAGTARAT